MLAVGTWILLCLTAVTSVAYLAITNLHRKRRPGEPPVVSGSWLWGSATEFGKDAVKFLHRCRAQGYGDIFTIRLINQHLTVITDPHSYEAMTKEKNFDFDPIQKQVNWNVFSFVLREPRKILKDTGKTVRGPYLDRGMRSFVNNLEHAFKKVAPENNPQRIYKALNNNDNQLWATEGLRHFTAMTLFDALFNTIFGRSDTDKFNSEMVYKNFEIFHQYFNYFWLGMPKKWFPSAMKALEELLCQPLAEDFLTRSDSSDYIKHAIEYMQSQGQTEGEIKGHNLVYLHVNYNTFRLAFWVLSHLLEDKAAMDALMTEINETVLDRAVDGVATFTQSDLEQMKVLNSVCQETMRLSSGVFVVRYVTEDTMFTMDNGKEYLVREGDRVAVYPPAIHKDPEIFEEPYTYKYDRFVDAKFFKNGKEVQHPVMAFGSLCPGKRYAILQLKWYIVSLLSKYQFQLPENYESPEYDFGYHGHEILPPVKDVNVHYTLRKDAVSLEFARE